MGTFLAAAFLLLAPLDAVRALFPGTKAVDTATHVSQATSLGGVSLPDALAGCSVWMVSGPPSRQEQAAALDLATRQVNEKRRLRIDQWI